MGYCGKGCSLEKIKQMIVWVSTNSLLNNFCQRENDSLDINKCNASPSTKLKLQTMQVPVKNASYKLKVNK